MFVLLLWQTVSQDRRTALELAIVYGGGGGGREVNGKGDGGVSGYREGGEPFPFLPFQ